jgi:hypothetical protein
LLVEKDIDSFVKGMKIKYKKCLHPYLDCNTDAIRAHSVSNAASLGMIAQNNHVYQFAMRIEGNGPVCRLEKIGRNKASTFTGLCADHDAELFQPIDREELSLEDPEQLFLIAYRSVTRELHVCLEGAMRIQNSYQRLVAEGKISNEESSPQGQAAYQHILKAWAAWKYRYKYFDLDIVKRKYRNLRHSIFMIADEKPCVAASAFLSVEPKPWGNVHPAVALNIIPLGPTYLAGWIPSPSAEAVRC